MKAQKYPAVVRAAHSGLTESTGPVLPQVSRWERRTGPLQFHEVWCFSFDITRALVLIRAFLTEAAHQFANY